MKLPRSFLDEIERRCSPREECVALLFGIGGEVSSWVWLKNVARSAIEFKVDPEEFYSALAEAEARGAELLAIFHTHPGPPVPSDLDLKYMRLWRVVWIIANVYTLELAGWMATPWGIKPINVEGI